MNGCEDKEQKDVLGEYNYKSFKFSPYDLNIIKIGL